MPKYEPLEPTTVLSLGAGVQSSTLALMASKGVNGIERPAFAIFADTQAEPQSVYDHLDWLEAQLDFEVVRATKGDLKAAVLRGRGVDAEFLDIPAFADKGDGKSGSLSKRQCTSHYKIRVIERVTRERVAHAAGRRNLSKGTPIMQQIGISTDEAHRMKDNKHSAITNTYPLIDIGFSRKDCLDWFNEYYPDRYLPRSACTFCPYHSDAEWKRLLTQEPDAFIDAVQVDDAIREKVGDKGYPMYLHRSCKPLSELTELFLNAEEDKYTTNANFGEECEGMCGV